MSQSGRLTLTAIVRPAALIRTAAQAFAVGSSNTCRDTAGAAPPARPRLLVTVRLFSLIVSSLLALATLAVGSASAAPDPAVDLPIAHISEAQTDGAAATCTVSAAITSIECSIRDTDADNHSVYVRWNGIAGQNGTLTNNGGSGTEVVRTDSSLARAIDGATFLRWKVCVDVQRWRDRCSDDVNVSSGPNGVPIDVYCANPGQTSQILSCELVENTEDWFLPAECATAVGKEVAQWATLRVARTVKILAKVIESRPGRAVLSVNDVVGGYEAVVECTY